MFSTGFVAAALRKYSANSMLSGSLFQDSTKDNRMKENLVAHQYTVFSESICNFNAPFYLLHL